MFLCKTTSTSNLQNTTFLLVSHLFTAAEALEQHHQCSLCGPAKEIWMKTSENKLVWLTKMVFTLHFCMGC
jgi:hypothetical protein